MSKSTYYKVVPDEDVLFDVLFDVTNNMQKYMIHREYVTKIENLEGINEEQRKK